METLHKLLEPEVLNTVLSILSLVLYLIGRITRQQFVAEQMKSKGMISKEEAKPVMADNVIGVVGSALDLIDAIPVINTRLPVVNASIPTLAKNILTSAVGLLGDILHNIPVVGTNVSRE